VSTKNKGYLIPANLNPPDELCFKIPVPNEAGYLRAFWGHIHELARWGMWEKEPTHSAVIAAARWHDSYKRIVPCDAPCEDCEECEDCTGTLEDCCFTFLPDDPKIEYAPNDPFRTPDHVPAGYLLPPWDLDDGRPSVGLDSLPIGIFNPIAILSGFPRFKVRCKGNGTALLYLRKAGNGGYAYITVDGNPAGTIVDLASWSILDFEGWADILAPIIGAITGNENPREIVEVQLVGSGEHYIDVTFLPKLGGLFVLQGFGGQLEQVKICTDEPQDMEPEMPPEFRMIDCVLEYRPNPDADWVTLGNLREDCPCECDDTEPPPEESVEWLCRAAKVFADTLLELGEEEVLRVVTSQPPQGLWSYPFEYMLPASTRDDERFVEAQGDWGSVEPDGFTDFINMASDPVWRDIVLTYLRRQFECLFLDAGHSIADYDWTPYNALETFAASLDLSASHALEVPPTGVWDVPNKAKDFADGLFYWFRPYAYSHFANMVLAINYEANLSGSHGEVPCINLDCGVTECRVESFVLSDVDPSRLYELGPNTGRHGTGNPSNSAYANPVSIGGGMNKTELLVTHEITACGAIGRLKMDILAGGLAPANAVAETWTETVEILSGGVWTEVYNFAEQMFTAPDTWITRTIYLDTVMTGSHLRHKITATHASSLFVISVDNVGFQSYD
jgi:hypothetical protein